MKKIGIGFLSLFLIVAITCNVHAGTENNASDWAKARIQEAYSLGLVPDELMDKMQENITRKEFCALAMSFYEAFTGYKGTSLNPSPFYDEQSPFVVRAYELNIISGVNETMFFPDDPLMREELPSMLARTLNASNSKFSLQAKNPEEFKDNYLISEDARDAVAFFSAEKVISGYNGYFYPKSFVTVEQAVIMFLNVYDLYHVEYFYMNDTRLRLGESLDTAKELLGEPEAVYTNEFGFARYLFHNNYKNFVMLGIKDNAIVEIYSNSPGFRYKNFSYGALLSDVVQKESVQIENNYADMGNRIEKAMIFFDENEEYEVDSIYIRYTDIINKFDQYTEEFLSDAGNLLFDFVNAARTAKGLDVLVWDETAAEAAKGHSLEMKQLDQVTYTGVSGSTPFERMEESGIAFSLAGEVISGEQRETIFVYNDWMQNVGTRSNLFSKEFKKAGIGCAMNGFKIQTTVDLYQ